MQLISDLRLERYVLGLTWGELPDAVRERARACALDLVGALSLGSLGRQFSVGLTLARSIFASGDVPILGSDERFSLVGATVAMGHAANSFDIDDGHSLIKRHPGASFISGLMAAALERNVTYGEFLTTLVAGYDALLLGAKLAYSCGPASLAVEYGQYSGRERKPAIAQGTGSGDSPQSLKSRLDLHFGAFSPFIYVQYGLRDWPFTQFRLGLAWNFDLLGHLRKNGDTKGR